MPEPARTARPFPLYAAGFTTAFGAHSIAASLGGYTESEQASLLTLGILLAIYDGAEVLLKPVFGTLADRIGPRPVLIGGLIGFAVASFAFVVAGNPGLVGVARFGQGAAAAAFSPAASAMVSRLTPSDEQGRAFGSYGAWKGLGFALGPILGAVLITIGGYSLLFSALGGLAVVIALWAAMTLPAVHVPPRTRQTVVDLVRRLTHRSFTIPTAALASATAALSVGVGFLPVIGAGEGLSPLATGAVVSLLAVTAAVMQPRVGSTRDAGQLSDAIAITAGLVASATGLAVAAIAPGLGGIVIAAVLIGIGTALITPVGFALLAAAAPKDRLGQTMGAAEVGRELGDAGGPLLVGAVATVLSLSSGFLTLAALFAVVTVLVVVVRSRADVSS